MSSGSSSGQSIAGKGQAASQDGKFLTFSLAGEEYGISILKVREIIGMMPIRTVPQTPSFVKGVINLRGKVIPVMSLRLKFGMEEIDYTEKTSIIVVDVSPTAEDVTHIGIVVDFVSEVINVRSSDVEPAPVFGDTLNTDYILGLAKIGSSVKILLSIDRVLSVEELGGLSLDF